METATSLLIGQLAEYLRGLTRRLDPGAGWYGEFLRRDPEGMRACLDGAAIPPWDVLASLLRDAGAVAGEAEYAARLRDAAAAAWDRAPGGARELRDMLARAAEQRSAAEAALARMTRLRDRATDPAQAAELTRELSWLQDDTSRARARQKDLTTRLRTLSTARDTDPPAPPPSGPPLPGVPGPRGADPGAGPEAPGAWAAPEDEASWALPGARYDASGTGSVREPMALVPGPRGADPGAGPLGQPPGPLPGAGYDDPGAGPEAPGAWAAPEDEPSWALPEARAAGPVVESDGAPSEPDPPVPGTGVPLGGVPRRRGAGPVGRAEGRWLRGGRRTGGARYAGAPAEAGPPSLPVETPQAPEAAPRGARFAHLAPAKATRDSAPPGPDTRPPLPPEASAAPPGPDTRPPLPPGATAPRPGIDSAGPSRSDAAPAVAPEAPADRPVAPSRHDAAGATVGRPAVSPWLGVDPAAPPRGGGPGAEPGVPVPPPMDGDAAAPPEVPQTVARLVGLRAQGRGGEAHALLCEAAGWPAGLLPEFAAELGRAGLGADWATLLWEAASLPPDRLAAAAAALGEAGRDADSDALLRQGAARPTAEIAEAALLLGAAGRDREADALLAAFVRLRTAEEAAALARRDPQWFAPRLLRAAAALAGGKHRDLSHALRVAGIPLP